jgi:hypothetical protein
MSEQYPGGFISKNSPTVTTSSAQGMWTLSQQAGYQQQGLWPPVVVGWMGAFTTGDTTVFRDLQIDSSGNIFAIGWNSTANGMTVVKTSKTGALLFVKTYNFTPVMNDPAFAAGQFQAISSIDSSNNIYFAFPTGYNGGGMIKINSDGVVQANMHVNPGTFHIFVGMKGTGVTSRFNTTGLSSSYYWSTYNFNNSLAITSESSQLPGNGSYPNPAVFAIALDSNGALWGSGQLSNTAGESVIAKGPTSFFNRFYQTPTVSGIQGGTCAMVGDNSGNMYHTPTLSAAGHIIKWSTSCAVTYAFRVDGGTAQTSGGCVDTSDNLYLMYAASGYNGGALLKLNSAGSILMQQRFTTATNASLNAVKVDPTDGSIVMVGNFGSTARGMIMRIPSTGAAGATWTVGGQTLACATSSAYSLSSVAFDKSNVGYDARATPAPTTGTATTSTPTPTWSVYG